jgi:hypothetical protein
MDESDLSEKHTDSIGSEAVKHSWLEFAGMFDPDDPIIQEWLEIMKQHRDRDEFV